MEKKRRCEPIPLPESYNTREGWWKWWSLIEDDPNKYCLTVGDFQAVHELKNWFVDPTNVKRKVEFVSEMLRSDTSAEIKEILLSFVHGEYAKSKGMTILL